MTRTSNTATSLLTRPEPAPLTGRNRDGVDAQQTARRPAPAHPWQVHQPSTTDDARARADSTPVPRGWGSHAERRLMLQALGVFVLLGLYAATFVLLGHFLST